MVERVAGQFCRMCCPCPEDEDGAFGPHNLFQNVSRHIIYHDILGSGQGGCVTAFDRGRQDLYGHLNMHRACQAGCKFGKGPVNKPQGISGRIGLQRPGANGLGRDALVDHLMQLSLPRVCVVQTRGDDQHRHAVGIGLTHGRHDVGQAGSGNHKTHAGLAGSACITVGHEANALLVARQNMGQARLIQATIQLDIMHAGNAEHVAHPVGCQTMRQLYAQSSCHHITLDP